eukprot:Skav204469  [mRNA]  locus=scaffold5533:92155:92391:- [translate_table: standard]
MSRTVHPTLLPAGGKADGKGAAKGGFGGKGPMAVGPMNAGPVGPMPMNPLAAMMGAMKGGKGGFGMPFGKGGKGWKGK